MKRLLLSEDKIAPVALNAIANYHSDVVQKVAQTVESQRVVVIGMNHNPFVGKILKALDANKITYTYLEYGNYFSQWKPRLAIKLWSGWPTFPQVFVSGKLIGGCNDALELLKAGKI
jgi:monothiol glutaredoxin